jgi:hypothetical protein
MGRKGYENTYTNLKLKYKFFAHVHCSDGRSDVGDIFEFFIWYDRCDQQDQ